MRKQLIHISHGNILLGELALALVASTGAAKPLALDQGLAVLVKLELGDLHLGRVDGNLHLGAVGLLLDDAIHVDAVAAAVHRGDLSYSFLRVLTPDDLNLVILADGKRPHLYSAALLSAPYATSSCTVWYQCMHSIILVVTPTLLLIERLISLHSSVAFSDSCQLAARLVFSEN